MTTTGPATDPALDAAADAYRSAFPPGDVLEFATSGLDRVGVPAWSVVWSPHAGRTEGPAVWHGGLGYGADLATAQLSAWGEAAEAVLLAEHGRGTPVRRASYARLRRELGRDGVVDPLTMCLEAGTAYDDERPLDWVHLRRWATGEQVLVPVDVVASDADAVPAAARTPPPGGRLTTFITNGQGAGDTAQRAVSHALGELLQRDGNGLRFRALDEGVVLDLGPDDCHVRDRAARSALRLLRAAGIRVLPKLASLDNGVVGIYVVGDDDDPPHPLMVTAAGEAAHPDRDIALRKALQEFAAARSRKLFMHGPLDTVARLVPDGYFDRVPIDPSREEPRALREMLRWTSLSADELRAALADSVLASRSVVSFDTLPTAPGTTTPEGLLAHLTDQLSQRGFDVLVQEAARGVATAVKVVVPGLEVETMSYARIGERGVRDLLARGDGRTGLHGFVGLGPAPDGASPVLLREEAHDRLGGRPWLDRVAMNRVVGGLYPLYREPGRHSVAVAREQGMRP